MAEELTDDSPMPFGQKHRGKRMADVPPDYYFWCWEGPKGPNFHTQPNHPVSRYIIKHWRRLCNEAPDYEPANHPPRDTRTATRPPGFTVIELVVVIAIFSIAIAVVIRNYRSNGEVRTFERNGHLYFEKRQWNGEAVVWGTPVHDPDCPKCNKSIEASK